MEAPTFPARRTVAVLQPSYLPWLGAFEQIARSDVFVFYDDVQFDKNGWRNRNRIRVHGDPGWIWLTLPVLRPQAFLPINEVQLDPRSPWRRKHRRALELAYATAPFRAELERFDSLFEGTSSRLDDVAIASTRILAEALGLSPQFVLSSELQVRGDRSERLVEICRTFDATHYYSGHAAKAYLDVAMFEQHGIHVTFQDFSHPAYEQCHHPFISHLSAIDALLCVGPERTRAMIDTGVVA